MAVVAVTTALCADQAAVGATVPAAARPQAADLAQAAEGLVSRLARGLRRVAGNVVPCDCPARPESLTGSAPVRRPTPPADVLAVHHPVSPFQFRLPPPLA